LHLHKLSIILIAPLTLPPHFPQTPFFILGFNLHISSMLTTEDSTTLQNREGNPLTALVDVVLIEHQWAVLGGKVTEHACEYTTVKA